ncbi:MAG: tetratricopeptide repeat protein [Phycisphaerales bacterium]|nr:tetratricopeptide repeat protein [Phycisphaerales bacterium]
MKRTREGKVASGGGRLRITLLVILGSTALAVFAVAIVLQLKSGPWSGPTPATPIAVSPAPAQPVRPSQVFDDYAGSESCLPCHAAEFEGWRHSNHGLAERSVDSEMDGPAFATVRTFQHGTQSTTVGGSGPFTVSTVGPAGRAEAFTAERVIGHDPLRQFLVAFPGGRLQTLEASYDPARDEWFNVYGEEDRKPGEWGHWTGRGMNWNNMCAACHNVRVKKNYDSRLDAYTTTMAERAVGCEACHGPMREHVRWRAANREFKGRHPDDRKFSAEQVFQTCGSCHARRSDLTGEFVPGDSFDDHFSLAVVDETETYYLDGQVHEENYEYAAFLGSRMHTAGVRCNDCHEPHTAKVRLPGNLMCMSCHAGKEGVPVIDPAKHGFHQLDALYSSVEGGPDAAALAARDRESVARSGGECINCHMPQTLYMQRHRRHDHGFTIPDPQLTKELGIPNACNRCHTDKEADWAIGCVNEWYGEKMQRPSRDRARLFAQARRGEEPARAALLAMLGTDISDYWRASAVSLLGIWAGEHATTAALIAATRHASPLVRAHAAQALGPLAGAGHAEVRPAIEPLLRDRSRGVRFHAARTMRDMLDERSPVGREYLEILEYIADQPAGRMERGAYELARGRPEEALPEYQKAVAWDPNSAGIRHDLAVTLATLGRSLEAVHELEEACRLAPQDAEYRYKLALVYHEVGRRDQAIASLQAAVGLDPAHTRAWYNLGLALDADGRTDEALASLARAESTAPGDPRAAYAAATIFAKTGRAAEARQAAERALAASPGFAPARELLMSLRGGPAGGGK